MDIELSSSAREALRGEGESLLDIAARCFTSSQWADWLQVPLENAAERGEPDLALKLARAGATIGWALHEAVRAGHEELTNVLLKRGAGTSDKDHNGDAPLHIAAREGYTEIVSALLNGGAYQDESNTDTCTPLHLAAKYGHVGVVEVLLSAGAIDSLRCEAKSAKEMYGLSAFDVAVYYENLDVIRTMIDAGADVNAVDMFSGRGPLHVAVSKEKGSLAAVDLLVEAGAYVNARGYLMAPSPPLAFAAMWSSAESVVALMKHGADIHEEDDCLRTPLHYAAQYAGVSGSARVVDILLRHGADETALDFENKIAADFVDSDNEEGSEGVDEQEVERVRKLLANAPADRTWRRRGFLVLCRAHPDRLLLLRQKSTAANAGTSQTTHGQGKVAKGKGKVAKTKGGCRSRGRGIGGDWTGVVARLLVMGEDDVFRATVGYL